jgi:glycosyltransferase involved in cell wall biosynthesis
VYGNDPRYFTGKKVVKILEAIATLDPGGAESLVSDLSIDLVQRGAEVKIFLIAGIRNERGMFLKNRLEKVGIEIIGSQSRKPATAQNLFHISKTLDVWQPDIVHCHLYNSAVAFSVARLFAIYKSVVYMRTLHSTEIAEKRSRIISKYLCHMFDYHIACSSSVEEMYRAFVGKSKTGIITTIPNGCLLADEHTDARGKYEAREQLSLPQDSFIYCNIGAFRGGSLVRSVKAQDILLQGFAKAFRNQNTVHLVFAGDGPTRTEAELLAKALGITEQTHFLGNIPESWPLLKAADVFTMPSRYEGLSLALLEAASTGLPIIASDIPEISSLKPGDGWLLCPIENVTALSDAMLTARNNYKEYLKRAQEQSDIIRERYSIEECGLHYWDLFNSAIKNKKTG